MPLGIFGGSGKDNGPKPQPLTSAEEEKPEKPQKKEKGIAGSSNNTLGETKDLRGTTIKLNKKTYTIERKLAEGGFAIVYIVNDKHNRNYALKRQLIRDDPRQVEACRTESQIVKNLNGHKNIIAYLDHQLFVNKAGIYDYMLLTVYYPANVLQLMNSRLLLNKWLSTHEIINIFCDVCEAVARLHHSKTPVIHRDLKVENVLVDQRTGSEKPVYILCDFGSATTKVLSKEHFTHAFIEDEIQRYTTLSYRPPEMIDLYSGVLIDTKSDIWALGVLLYKLCFFSLPFGESALAIQSGLFTFPEAPPISDEIKAIINLLLTLNARHRPNIYQTAHLAFSAAGLKCPVYNIEKSPRIELNEAVQILKMRNKLGSDYTRLYEKAFNEFEAQKRRHTAPSVARGDSSTVDEKDRASKEEAEKPPQALSPRSKELPNIEHSRHFAASMSPIPVEGVIVNTASGEMHARSMTTSVNPRLRPKPQQIASTTPTPATRQNHQRQSNSQTTPNTTTTNIASTNETPTNLFSSHIHQHSASTSTSVDTIDSRISNRHTQKAGVTPQSSKQSPKLHTSAFRPYTLSHDASANTLSLCPQTLGEEEGPPPMFESSNPFIQPSTSTTTVDPNMDDRLFGECFDEMRKCAIFEQPVSSSNTVADSDSIGATTKTDEVRQHSSQEDEQNRRSQTQNSPGQQQRVSLDWPTIEKLIGDDPFTSAPPILAHQHLHFSKQN